MASKEKVMTTQSLQQTRLPLPTSPISVITCPDIKSSVSIEQVGLGPGSRKPGLPGVRRQKKSPMSDPGSLFAKVGRLGGFDGQERKTLIGILAKQVGTDVID
ncbi:hypothetical protein OUZ56_032257 [Daphnia magna]|uniref:Uncharacterized protein n=1 Tax=Daphnia magna TaxID=35525 RepID=A0ABQ9ZWM5_9CRUS|nr:hypothetical protein OUZ56_032257 [Daphnia magna]